MESGNRSSRSASEARYSSTDAVISSAEAGGRMETDVFSSFARGRPDDPWWAMSGRNSFRGRCDEMREDGSGVLEKE